MPIKDSGSQITIDEIVSSFIDDKQSPIQLSPAQPSFQQSASATVVIYKQKFLKAPIITNYKDVFAGLKDNSLKRVNITKKRSPAWEIFDHIYYLDTCTDWVACSKCQYACKHCSKTGNKLIL